MTASEILSAAADLIEEKGWTQDYFARDAMGRKTYSKSSEAVCFCAIGAMFCVAPVEDNGDAYSDAETALAAVIGNDNVPNWNDDPDRTAREVITALRCAAEKAVVA